jgi:hypothetical protein
MLNSLLGKVTPCFRPLIKTDLNHTTRKQVRRVWERRGTRRLILLPYSVWYEDPPYGGSSLAKKFILLAVRCTLPAAGRRPPIRVFLWFKLASEWGFAAFIRSASTF